MKKATSKPPAIHLGQVYLRIYVLGVVGLMSEVAGVYVDVRIRVITRSWMARACWLFLPRWVVFGPERFTAALYQRTPNIEQ